MSVTSNQLLNQVKQGIAEVGVAEVQERLKAGKPLHIVDVREREEVMDGYIPGAALIPRGFLELNIEEDVTMDRDAEIVLYCA
ncbi:MAG: rhodanese-like domain-containing protein, partial [Candidatus Latescibacterota bacterium]